MGSFWDNVKEKTTQVKTQARVQVPYRASRLRENVEAPAAYVGNMIGAAGDVFDAFASEGVKPVSHIAEQGVEALSQVGERAAAGVEAGTAAVTATGKMAAAELADRGAKTLQNAGFSAGALVPGVGGFMDRASRGLAESSMDLRMSALEDAQRVEERGQFAQSPLTAATPQGTETLEPVDLEQFKSDLDEDISERLARGRQISEDFGRKQRSDKRALVGAQRRAEAEGRISGESGDIYGRELRGDKGVQVTAEEALNLILAAVGSGALPAAAQAGKPVLRGVLKGADKAAPTVGQAAQRAPEKAAEAIKPILAAAGATRSGKVAKKLGKVAKKQRASRRRKRKQRKGKK